MKFDLTKDEQEVIQAMNKYISFRSVTDEKVVSLTPKKYRCYLGIVEKKENQNPGYGHLKIIDKKYDGYEVKRAGT